MSVLGLSNKARIITPQLAETERNRWFVGTFSSTNKVSEIDKIILIDFDEDIDEITTLNFNFSTPITSISPNPKEKSLFIVTGVDHCALYRLPELPNEPFRSDNFELEKVFDIPTDTVDHIIGVTWSPTGKRALVYSNTIAVIYTIDKTPKFEKELNIHETIQCAVWNPHHEKTVAFGAGTNIIEWDLKQNQLCNRIEFAHDIGIRSLDYNHNKPYHLASCGDDSLVRIWDTRAKKQLLELSDHTHWIWSVQFNKFHDQLLLTCSSDSQVNLQSVVSVSSVPLESDGESQKTVDGLISTFDQHEDSVYSVAWSPSDPWIFASVSFDGRVVVNLVPQDHKYKIIL